MPTPTAPASPAPAASRKRSQQKLAPILPEYGIPGAVFFCLTDEQVLTLRPDGRGFLTITRARAHASGTDAANQQMRAAGRDRWNEDDYDLAAGTQNYLCYCGGFITAQMFVQLGGDPARVQVAA